MTTGGFELFSGRLSYHRHRVEIESLSGNLAITPTQIYCTPKKSRMNFLSIVLSRFLFTYLQNALILA